MRRPALRLLLVAWAAFAASADDPPVRIDLPAALRLAGADLPEILRVRAALQEAVAAEHQARQRNHPWVVPGVALRRHDGMVADSRGDLDEVDKFSYAPGVTVGAAWTPGETRYRILAARQRVAAAGHDLDHAGRLATLRAAIGYLELARARAAVVILETGIAEAADYQTQVEAAVRNGLAFAGDAHRAAAQADRLRASRAQAEEERRLHAARLADLLRLDPVQDLQPEVEELLPLPALPEHASLNGLLARVEGQPDVLAAKARAQEAEDMTAAVVEGPRRPAIGLHAFVGGLGGEGEAGDRDFGFQQEYALTLGWKFGPGGLRDPAGTAAARARQDQQDADLELVRRRAVLQAVEAHTRWRMAGERLAATAQALAAANETARLTAARREFGVGVVLEAIQAAQDQVRARLDHARSVTDLNRARFELEYAAGRP